MSRILLKIKNSQKGVGLVEVLVGSAILSIVLFAFTSSLSLYSRANADAMSRSQALYLAEEALEVVRGLRDASWTTHIAPVTVDTGRGLIFNEVSSTWTIVSSPDTFEEFTRTLTLRDVYRDSNDNIVSDTSEVFDPDSRMVEVEVSWAGVEETQSVRLESVITNVFE
jgi:type II secretory pathway pseudopilin PulG